jgi:hypothetical protein
MGETYSLHGKDTKAYKFQSENTKERVCLEDVSAHGRLILLLFVKKPDKRVLIDFN